MYYPELISVPCVILVPQNSDKEKTAKIKPSTAKLVLSLFKNASKTKCLEESRAGKIKGKAKPDLKSRGLCFHILRLALKNMAVARHPWPALVVPAEDTVVASPLLLAYYHALE